MSYRDYDVWQESKDAPWYWEVYDVDDDGDETILKSGIEPTRERAMIAVKRAFPKAAQCRQETP